MRDEPRITPRLLTHTTEINRVELTESVKLRKELLKDGAGVYGQNALI